MISRAPTGIATLACLILALTQPGRARPGEGEDCFRLPSSGQSVKGRIMLLGIDDRSLPFRRNLVCYLSKPEIRPEAVLRPSRDNREAPDYVAARFLGTVLLDGGKFRMWYVGFPPTADFTGIIQGPVCYGESGDGIHWTKPDLGLVEFHGNRNNNAIALPTEADGELEDVGVIKDEGDPDPQRRYKLIYLPQHPERKYDWSLRTATSPDGLHWTASRAGLVSSFMEFSGFYQHGGLYIIPAHTYERGEGGRPQGRQGYVWVSTDFNTWLPEYAPSYALPEPLMGPGYGGEYVQEHEGVAGVDFGNVVVGLYCRWHQTKPLADGQTDWEGRFADLGLALSQDGIHYYEPVRDWVYISSLESPATPLPGKHYKTLLLPTSSIINYRDRTLIYYGRWRNVNPYTKTPRALDYYAEVGLATLPRDRWGALGLRPALPLPAGESSYPAGVEALQAAAEGAVWSEPIQLPSVRDASVWLNADGARGLKVEMADSDFRLLPGFSGRDGGRPADASGLDCRVVWPGGGLGGLRGRTVRLRIGFAREQAPDPRLYAAYLRVD